jgi:hypothetical protein
MIHKATHTGPLARGEEGGSEASNAFLDAFGGQLMTSSSNGTIVNSDEIMAELTEMLGGEADDMMEVKVAQQAGACYRGKNWCCVIHPMSTFHSMWDFVVSIVLMITIITMPISMAFEGMNDDMFWFNFLVDVIFISDLFKSFFTGFIIEEEDDYVELSHKKIIRNYLQGWFVPDLVSSVPLDAILKWSGAGDAEGADLARSSKALKLLRLMRLAKLFRLMRVSRVFRYVRFAKAIIEDKFKIRIPDAFIKMMRLLLILLLFAHWLGCVNFMVLKMNEFPHDSW